MNNNLHNSLYSLSICRKDDKKAIGRHVAKLKKQAHMDKKDLGKQVGAIVKDLRKLEVSISQDVSICDDLKEYMLSHLQDLSSAIQEWKCQT